MSVSMHPARKLRIVGKPGDTKGYMLEVFDHDTGEEINNIIRVTLELDVLKESTAQVTYYEPDAQKTVTTKDPEVDVTALLLNSWREKEI